MLVPKHTETPPCGDPPDRKNYFSLSFFEHTGGGAPSRSSPTRLIKTNSKRDLPTLPLCGKHELAGKLQAGNCPEGVPSKWRQTYLHVSPPIAVPHLGIITSLRARQICANNVAVPFASKWCRAHNCDFSNTCKLNGQSRPLELRVLTDGRNRRVSPKRLTLLKRMTSLITPIFPVS